MNRIFTKNLIILIIMLLLVLPCNAMTQSLAIYLRFDRYLPLIFYSLCCGILFSLLDFSSKTVNWFLFLSFLIISLLGIFTSIYPFGTTIFFYIFMVGATLPHLFAKNIS